MPKLAFAACLLLAGGLSPLLFADVPRIKYVAHRGDYPDVPEGSMAAYRNAVERGSEIVKLDVHPSKDGVIVMSHDPSFKRTMGWDVRIADVSWDEIQRHTYLFRGKPTEEKAVSLPAVLKVVKVIPEFWIDFKHFDPEFCERVLAEFAKAGIPRHRIMVATYTRPALLYMKAHHSDIRRVGHMDFRLEKGRWSPSFARAEGVTYAAAREGEPMAGEVVDGIRAYASKMGLWGINICADPKIVTKELVSALHSSGLWVSIALIHTKPHAELFVGFGNDCVVTRDRRTVKPILDRAISATATAGEWRFEVAANAPRVVSCRVDAKLAERMATQEVVAVSEDGRETPVEWAIDASGEMPELVWRADGRRSFALRPRSSAPNGGRSAAARPLMAAERGDEIVVGNEFFSLRHPAKGKGGFPEQLRFVQSGAVDDGFQFIDRLVRRNAAGGVDVLPVRNDGEASARLAFSSPLRAVVEAKAKVASVDLVYRYVYEASSPVVRVDVVCRQAKSDPWAEAWTVGLCWNRNSPRYGSYCTSRDDAPIPLQTKGKPSKQFSGLWSVLTDGTNAVGVSSVYGAVGWDASSSFVYYLLAQREGWRTATLGRSALLYFGPVVGREDFDNAFAAVRPRVKVLRNGLRWVPTKPLSPPSGATLLEGKGIRLAFDTADRGFNCIGIENRVNPDPAAFCDGEQGRASFWSLKFWKDGSPTNTLAIDNLAPCERSVERSEGGMLVFDWRGLSLGDERGVVDVRATVAIEQDGTAATWRIAVKNRSARWGLAETAYPLLCNVVRPLEADVLTPRGNLGGRIVESYRGGVASRYPGSMGAQVQTCAFLRGGTGLQISALDGKGQEKVLDLSGLDFTLRYRCPNEGVPGAANAPDFAVETAAFSGDWWSAAKRYRAWATRQVAAKSKGRIGDVGYWIKNDGAHGSPAQVSNIMERAFAALPGIPLGLHWYCWHKGPFDHYYPELFPERRGMKETVAWLKKKGVLVMPYINGRLWDNGIASYSNAIPYACKRPDGTCYVEDYGSGRKFAPMCPVTKQWQQTIDALCDRLEDEIGVNAIYLDQVSASMPAPCHDKTHGHMLGGGSHWQGGYREMMAQIRGKAAQRGVALTSENAAEPYLDSFDAHLTWFGHSFDDVPLLPAVYSGYAVYFASMEDAKDTLDSYCAQQGQDFLWGIQLGWTDPWILDDKHTEHLVFTTRLCRERLANKEFFLEGELMGELPTPPDVPMVEVQWRRVGNYCNSSRFKTPAVRAAVWRDGPGNRRAFFVNISGEAQSFTYGSGAERKRIVIPPRSVAAEDMFN